ncbi:MAG: transglutaminase domain-containing protein [Planctomycetota bacterium]|nr:MAG: transglutaminase domain-containing protein [Planctomycetota bacterium]
MMLNGLPLHMDAVDNTVHARSQRHFLRLGHSGLIIALALYLAVTYDAAAGPVLALAATALVAEWMPWRWRRYFVPEWCLLGAGLLSYGWTIYLDGSIRGFAGVIDPSTAFAGWIRMVLVFWALVPSRLHMAKVAAALIAGEFLLLAGFSEVRWWTASALLGLILFCLWLQEWSSGLHSRNDHVNVGKPFLAQPWGKAAIACLLLALVATAAASAIRTQFTPEIAEADGGNGTPVASGEHQIDLSQSISLDDNMFTDQDPTLAARLLWDQPPTMARGSLVYLRAMTVPELVLVQDRVTWRASGVPIRRFETIPTLHYHHEPEMATLFRSRGSGDMVLRPDHSALVDLYGLLGDRDGNLFRPGLGQFPRRYAVDLGGSASPSPSFEDDHPQRYLELPAVVREFLNQQLPDLYRWRSMSSTAAAASIHDWLRRRNRYSLHQLPRPLPGPAGDLRAFLFGGDEQRQGHCQYFATAAVALLRASGHPARPVLGYASDEWDGSGATFRVLHAHAWSEFRDRHGNWVRLDTTPPAGLQERAAGIPLDGEEDWNAEEFLEDHQAIGSLVDHPWWWLSLALPPSLLAILLLRSLWRQCRHGDPSWRRRQRETHALLSCAWDCGIAITPASTLDGIANELAEKSGVDLSAYLEQHLRERFGAGPPAAAWPVKQIRRAYRVRHGKA